MRILRDRPQLVAMHREWARKGRGTIALVPTMGHLHEGHMTLIRHARARAQRVVVSIFVNPMQFDRAEDLERYPRTLEEDSRLLTEAGVDAVFCPSEEDMYPNDGMPPVRVVVPQLSEILEGAFRPGHFDGVATVVTKLFNLVRPDLALFGEKDYQQFKLVERMVQGLDIPVRVEAIPTVREKDGLACSSRNDQLPEEARAIAPELKRVLDEVATVCRGATVFDAERIPEVEGRACDRLREVGFDPEYLSIRRAEDLAEPENGVPLANQDLVVLAAAWLAEVRLIDSVRTRPAG
ncbi:MULTISPECIES: pantoate--beta-alanine ligase [unclassified Thioalkalivibrio]|uniref:pantoate--beta-alanine ligase n=1 Tax=unclassified Thioalkalivibrio TaxID=2621013 RepID=UPI000367CCDE|nr:MULTISPECIES: pantoate--beta-alanine ligase [unclassified Thioalkalivibrio]